MLGYKIIICEDNKIELKIIVTYILSFAEQYKIEVDLRRFSDINEALVCAENEKMDIAFLDINMGQSQPTGIQLAASLLKKNQEIVNIFITGEMVSVPEVFKVRTFDYIQKPIDSLVFDNAFVRAIKQVNGIRSRRHMDSLVVVVNNLKIKLIQNNIIYLEREGTRTKIALTDGSELYVYETIKSLKSRVNGDFLQINQGVLINTGKVKDYVKEEFFLNNGVRFKVGRTYRKEADMYYKV